MSIDYLRLIPSDPAYMPDLRAQQEARDLLSSFFPEARKIQAHAYEHVAFIDPGEYFDKVLCPFCKAEIDETWWQAAYKKAYEQKFADLTATTPCCTKTISLNDLIFKSPAGFARFELTAHTDDPSTVISQDQMRRLEGILRCHLRSVLTRY